MGNLTGRPMKTRARSGQLPRRKAAEAHMAQSSVIGAKAKNGNGHKAQVATKGKSSKARSTGGITVTRRYTQPGIDPLEAGAPGEHGQPLVYERRSSVITNPDGSIVFKMEGAEIPTGWSQLATDIVISKYFRKAGLYGDKDQGETSVRQVVHRIAHTIRSAGERFGGYFATTADADAFEAELSWLMLHQYGAFNSPVWFNCGLFHEYGIVGSGGNWAVDLETHEAQQTANAY